jgi:hypothetical protein
MKLCLQVIEASCRFGRVRTVRPGSISQAAVTEVIWDVKL